MNQVVMQQKNFVEHEETQDKLNIVFISANSETAFARYMYYQMKKRGHKAQYFPALETLVEILNAIGNPVSVGYYSASGNPFSLKEFLKFKKIDLETIDIIFVEQNFAYFKNDIDVPVIYYHRDLWTEVFMRKPDLLLYRFANHYTALQYISRQTWKNTKYKLQFKNAVAMREWDCSKEKIYEGLNYISPRIHLERYLAQDYIQHDYYENTYEITEYARTNDIATIHDYYKISREQFKSLLEQSEALLFIPGRNAYLSRLLYEAAACKTLLVIYVPNKYAEKQYQNLGLTHGYNCVMFKDKKELKNVFILYRHKSKKIIEKAYEWVKENHTIKHRADELEKIFYQLIKKMEVKSNE